MSHLPLPKTKDLTPVESAVAIFVDGVFRAMESTLSNTGRKHFLEVYKARAGESKKAESSAQALLELEMIESVFLGEEHNAT